MLMKNRNISTPLMALGSLKKYIPYATWFLLGTIIRLPKFVNSIDHKYSKDLRKTCGFIALVYKRLQKRFSKEKAYEITRAVVLPTSFAVMQANFKVGEEKRTFSNLIKYQQLTNQIGVTKENDMVVLKEDENEYKFAIKKCMFHQVFSSIDAPELTKIMCQVDNAIFNTYLPNEYVFTRGVGKTIVEGNEECHFHVHKADM